jgi:hypothetical protein
VVDVGLLVAWFTQRRDDQRIGADIAMGVMVVMGWLATEFANEISPTADRRPRW